MLQMNKAYCYFVYWLTQQRLGDAIMHNYSDFVAELIKAGFSFADGGNNEGVFNLLKYGWHEEPPDSPIRWHTGDKETDPWEWRIRVLDERNDIAYSKLFFRKAGYITKEWYPYFLSVRRNNKSFEDEYRSGTISHFAKRIYDIVDECGNISLHEIRRIAGFSRADKSKFERALTDLQMKMYLSICGTQQRISQMGKPYAWPSMVFCTTECFFGEEMFERATQISAVEAINKITEQVFILNPYAQEARVIKFIKG